MDDYQRRLPHIHPDGVYLFVTWRLHGSLPVPAPEIIYATPGQTFAARDRALARDRTCLWLSDTRVARLVADTIRQGEQEKALYDTQAWVIMPNHVHLLILPHFELRVITQWIKGRTAREANRLLGRAGGPFWQHESYDHWLRSETELPRVVRYIEQNPVSAGLVATPVEWRWSSAWGKL